MAVLIDTSVFITLERTGRTLSALIRPIPGEPLALSSITASELLVGVHRANTEPRRRTREAFVETIFTTVPLVQFDLSAARVHARLSAQLAAVGQPFGAHDLLIGATALTHGYGVLTENVRDFARVPGLVVRQPTW